MVDVSSQNERAKLPVLWVVVPCLNEAATLVESAYTLIYFLDMFVQEGRIAPQSKLLFVDDGSTDATWSTIESLHASSKKCSADATKECLASASKECLATSLEECPTAPQTSISCSGIRLAHNTGQQCALYAGLMCALEGGCDCAITIDADLQDDPEAMRAMLDHFAQGAEVVYGVRHERSSDGIFKRMSAKMFYRLMRLLGAETVIDSADFRLMGKRSLCVLAEFSETNLFLRALVPSLGFPSAQVSYTRRPRRGGTTKYCLGKMLSLAMGGITSSSIQPVRLVTIGGIVAVLISVGMIVYALASAFMGSVVAGWTSLMISIWMVGGLIMMSLGIVGEYVARTYLETKRRPRYVIIDKCL